MKRVLISAVWCVFLMLTTSFAGASVSFSRDILPSTPSQLGMADLNGDGREDLISVCDTGAGNGNREIAVTLSVADGTYAPQVCYPLPSGSVNGIGVAVGDFNGDGFLDMAAMNGGNTIYEYLNNGDGSFRFQASFVAPTAQMTSIVAADANHDGHMDLIFVGFADMNLYVWFGDGEGGFTAGPISAFPDEGSLSIGDFDGDGKVDILAQMNAFGNVLQVFYGDGLGHFEGTSQFTDDAVFKPYDLNHDGKTDLVGDPFDFSTHNSTYYKIVRVWYGNSNRTLSKQDISLNQCTAGALYPAVGDFNGDGIGDLAVIEASDCHGSGPYSVNILLGKGNGSYEPEQKIYSSESFGTLYQMRVNRDTKPDLLLQGDAAPGKFEMVFFTDTTPGNFPKCRAPNSGTGIALCSPTREVVAKSPVAFHVAAANQTPGRKMEVWVDGTKVGEQLTGWSHYSYLDNHFNLAAGPHSVTVFSAGWDNLVESVTFPLVVGSGRCAPPASPGLNVCSPLPGASLGANALAWASGTVAGTILRMEVWVDGVKKFSTFGPDTLKTTLSLPSGTHSFAYFIVNTAGQKWESTVVASVK